MRDGQTFLLSGVVEQSIDVDWQVQVEIAVGSDDAVIAKLGSSAIHSRER